MKVSLLSGAALISLALSGALPDLTKVDYSGFKALRLTLPEGAANLTDQINELAAAILNSDSGDTLDIVSSPENVHAISQLAANTTILMEDMGASFAEEYFSTDYTAPGDAWFTAYHNYADHLTFLNDLQNSFPSHSEVFTLGKTFNGRDLTGIHIWGSGVKGSKPAVVLHGTVHAREWITTLTTEYMAYQLLSKYATDPVVRAVVDKFDFYITPIANPDGFVYTQTEDRLWRKNRENVFGHYCVGRDPSRNWPFKWEFGGSDTTNPCLESFKGLAPGDSLEVKALKGQIDSLSASKGISLFLDFHSFGQYILWPFGYDCTLVGTDETSLRSLAERAAADIMAVYVTMYQVGNSCRLLKQTTGSSADYVHGVAGSKYTYTFKLRDLLTYGYSLPANQIQPTVNETWAAVLPMLQAV
ncbi:zinc carboxypeptidase [Colletotrichum tabaci]|uniref:Zinc carboxypeptidase n=1 Tax=Colletotrichum tabaci TaxID=1209068 RepID=A0AAV9TJX3_9PEZI